MASIKFQSQREITVMGKYYTDEQIQETIAALESYSPGVFEKMKKVSQIRDPRVGEHAADLWDIIRASTAVLPKMPFVAQAEDKLGAENCLRIDVRETVRSAVAAAKGGS